GRCIQVLDYAHRRDDGSVGSIPDSLKRTFKTTNGRTVYDGGGIDPDIKTESEEAHPLTQVLFEKGLIFDYANQYVANHPEKPDPKNWSLTDNEYQEFVNWVSSKDYSYTSYLEFGLQHFTEEARKEKYYPELAGDLEEIRRRIAVSKKDELKLYKNQIKVILEKEIMARHYLEKGSIETGFKYDRELKQAVDVLHNPAQYRKILNIQP